MEEKKKCCCKVKAEEKDSKKLPGIAIDMGDDNKVDKKLVKQETDILNNNPQS